MSNTIGKLFTFTSFGESHGVAIGGVIDGCPAGLLLDMDFVQSELDRRRPGQSEITTERAESDKVEFLSGIFEGKTTGAPIAFIIHNTNSQSKDYEHLRNVYRPSHADFTYSQKYGIRDYRGGGRSSARETATRVVAGAVAKLVLRQKGISINAFTSQVGHIAISNDINNLDLSLTESNTVRCPEPDTAQKMFDYISAIKREGDSIGGIVTCVINNMPTGIGEPIFDKLNARLAAAMLSINAAHGFDYGSGFEGVALRGSETNDNFFIDNNNNISTKTNNSGGIQGGISNGQQIYFRVLFKPTATIFKTQQTVNTAGENVELAAHGRHDPCVVPRAVPIVEAMAAMTILDLMMEKN
ncbi:MAG: chorismate synthase [Paludibacter sp.]|jgi:chorismate synthase|nr:chorismate synthase [Paludibacter sp.]